MATVANTPHQRDGMNAPALLPISPKRSIPNRPISGRTHSISRHPPGVERAEFNSVPPPEDKPGDSTLAFEAIHDAFQAQRTMLRAFAQLRGDDDADVLW